MKKKKKKIDGGVEEGRNERNNLNRTIKIIKQNLRDFWRNKAVFALKHWKAQRNWFTVKRFSGFEQ